MRASGTPVRILVGLPAADPRRPHGHHRPLALACTVVLAFCSTLYELLLGQTLSAFLGNTVLRYSVTIGLYMASMGFGAMHATRRVVARPVLPLQGVERLLTLLGGSSVLLLLGADALGWGVPAITELALGTCLGR